MIAFQNLLDDSLQAIVNKPVEALVVVAILPAIIEEFLFRGRSTVELRTKVIKR